MTLISKNVYIDKLDDIGNKYSNKYHDTIKMKPTDAKSSMYIDFDVENKDKDPKFEIGIFPKGYPTSLSKDDFVFWKVKKTLIREELLERVVKKNCKSKPESRIEE